SLSETASPTMQPSSTKNLALPVFCLQPERSLPLNKLIQPSLAKSSGAATIENANRISLNLRIIENRLLPAGRWERWKYCRAREGSSLRCAWRGERTRHAKPE